MMTLKRYESDSEGVCPPEDTYTWELAEIGSFEEQQSTGFREGDPDVINTQARLVWKLVDHDYDPDYDAQDWNGLEVYTYLTVYRRKVGEDEAMNKSIFLSNRSAAFQVLTALGYDVEGGEDIDLKKALGRRVKGAIEKKASGWPRIATFSKTRQPRPKKTVEESGSEDTDEPEASKSSPFKRDNAA